MLLDYLKENYSCNEPIFINDIMLDGLSDNALRQGFNRLLKTGQIERFDTGIYYLSKTDSVLKNTYLDSNKVINKKYITDGTNVYGYVTGFTFANQMGLTTQLPAITEIVTNEESSKGRNVTIGKRKIRIKRPKVEITADNCKILQFLDLVNAYENWAECDEKTTQEIFVNYVNQEKLDRDRLRRFISYYPGSVAKKLIEMELVYAFTS